jgi:hypothetical protein
MTWRCDGCTQEVEGVSIHDIRRAGAYVEPTDPDSECASCGDRPSEAVRTRLLLERLVHSQRVAPWEAPVPVVRRRNTAAGILSARTAAQRLGIGRDTLARLVEVGQIASVPKGKRPGYRSADVEALVNRGFTLPDDAARPAPKAKRRRAPKSNGAGPAQRIADLDF